MKSRSSVGQLLLKCDSVDFSFLGKVAIHSPILMTYPDAQIFEYTVKGAKEKKYYELDRFNLTRDFLNCPERMLGKLFGE